MKPTRHKVQKPAAVPPAPALAASQGRRDEMLALRSMNAALTGLLAANSARDDGMFWDNLQMDELTDQASETGLMLFLKFEQWAADRRSVHELEDKSL